MCVADLCHFLQHNFMRRYFCRVAIAESSRAHALLGFAAIQLFDYVHNVLDVVGIDEQSRQGVQSVID